MMRSKKAIKFVFISIAILLTYGCAFKNTQFKHEVVTNSNECDSIETAYSIGGSRCNVGNVRIDSNTSFNVIEIDDFGEFFDVKQVEKAKEAIGESASKAPTVLLVYIHGWKHNASEESGNLHDFRTLVAQVGRNTCVLTPSEAAISAIKDENGCIYKNVVGVYIGWRGKPFGSGLFQILNNLTFWNRKSTTRNIASASVVSMLLDLSKSLRKGDIARLKENIDDHASCTYAQYLESKEVCSRSVVIGHSFGGRILETAVSQALIGSRFLASQVGIKEFIQQTKESASEMIEIAENLERTNIRRQEVIHSIETELTEQKNRLEELETIEASLEENEKRLKKESNSLDGTTRKAFNSASALPERLIQPNIADSESKVECEVYWLLSRNISDLGDSACQVADFQLASRDVANRVHSEYCQYLSKINSTDHRKMKCSVADKKIGFLDQFKKFVAKGFKKLAELTTPDSQFTADWQTTPDSYLNSMAKQLSVMIKDLKSATKILNRIKAIRLEAIAENQQLISKSHDDSNLLYSRLIGIFQDIANNESKNNEDADNLSKLESTAKDEKLALPGDIKEEKPIESSDIASKILELDQVWSDTDLGTRIAILRNEVNWVNTPLKENGRGDGGKIATLLVDVDNIEKTFRLLTRRIEVLQSKNNFESNVQFHIDNLETITAVFSQENSKLLKNKEIYNSGSGRLDLYTELLGEVTLRKQSTEKAIGESGEYVDSLNKRLEELLAEKKEQEIQLEKVLASFVNGVSEIELVLESTTRPPFNLAVLVNPATGAIDSRMISDFLCDKEFESNFGGYQTVEFPWLVSLASEKDFAIKNIFGIGTSVGTYFSFDGQPDIEIAKAGYVGTGCRPDKRKNVSEIDHSGKGDLVYSQELLNKTPAPFIEGLQTHAVEKIKLTNKFIENCIVDEYHGVKDTTITMIDGIYAGSLINQKRLSSHCVNYIGTYPNVYKESESPETVAYKLDTSTTSDSVSDYWIMQLPESIVSDHNDVFTYELGKLLNILQYMQKGIGSECVNLKPYANSSGQKNQLSEFCELLKIKRQILEGDINF